MHTAAAKSEPNALCDADILTFDLPDAALEKAAAASLGGAGGAMSFPNAPTVSIIVVCCSFNGS